MLRAEKRVGLLIRESVWFFWIFFTRIRIRSWIWTLLCRFAWKMKLSEPACTVVVCRHRLVHKIEIKVWGEIDLNLNFWRGRMKSGIRSRPDRPFLPRTENMSAPAHFVTLKKIYYWKIRILWAGAVAGSKTSLLPSLLLKQYWCSFADPDISGYQIKN